MSKFINNKITESGLALLAKIRAEEGNLEFTRVGVGVGKLRDDQNMCLMTQLNDEKISIENFNCTTEKNMAHIRATFSFEDISSEDFYCREIGLFVRDEENPSEPEILFCYGNMGNESERVPLVEGIYRTECMIEFNLVIDNASSATALISSEIEYVKAKDLEKTVENLKERIEKIPKPTFYYFTPQSTNRASESNIDTFLEFGEGNTNYHLLYSDPGGGFRVPFESNMIFRASIDIAGYGTHYSNAWNGANLKLVISGSSEQDINNGGDIEKYRRLAVKGTDFNRNWFFIRNDQYVRSTVTFECVMKNQMPNTPIIPKIYVARIANDAGQSVHVYGYSVIIEAYPTKR